MKKLLLLAAAAATAATISTAAFASNTCVRNNDISNFTALNDRQVVVENYRHQKVLLKLIGTCSNLRFHDSLAISQRGESGLSCITAGDTIMTRDSGTSGTCAIVSVTSYSGSMSMHHHDSDHAHHDSY